jgi:6-phosphogluconolactonase
MIETTFSRLAFADGQTLARDFADWTATLLAEAIAARGLALLVVSGGSTPKRYFAELSKRDLDWTRVAVTLADERRVPDDSARSNAKLLRETLLQGGASKAQFCPLADARLAPERELAAAAWATTATPPPGSRTRPGSPKPSTRRRGRWWRLWRRRTAWSRA